MPADDRARLVWAVDLVVDALHLVYGDEVAGRLHAESVQHADQHMPWDRKGDEPIDRLLLRLHDLTDGLSRASDGTADRANIVTE